MPRLALMVVWLALLLAPSAYAQQPPITLVDATGTEVTLTRWERIISGSGDVTEIIDALGFYDRLVAVDRSSTYPEKALAELPDIGFARALAAEPIAALNPDLFFCTQICAPAETLEQLRVLGIPVVIVPDSEDGGLELPFQKIEMVAAALGVPEAGALLAERVRREIGWVQTATANVAERPAVFHFYIRGRGLQLAVGSGTPADAMIVGAGGINAAVEAGVTGYQTLSPEIILTAFPDYILLTQGNVDNSGGLEEVLAVQGLSATPAVREGNVIVMDTLLLLGMSVRTGQALMTLAEAIHPSMTWETRISYPYSLTDATGTAITVSDAPRIVIATNDDLLATARALGFHAEMADAAPDGALILAEPGDVWQPLRESGALVIVLEENPSPAQVAAALNVPGRAAALAAATAP